MTVARIAMENSQCSPGADAADHGVMSSSKFSEIVGDYAVSLFSDMTMPARGRDKSHFCRR